ncbi:MAG: hypothetical protein OHK0029_03040 [Armatimonadaceae bacterium]
MTSPWHITYGNYTLTVDRKTRCYRLTDARTGMVWADGLSLGWMDLKDRSTGAVSRHEFAAMPTFSVSEKSGAQGKRILFGLECEGVPLDIYLICSEREIQMVVESNRDSRTHTVEGFGLLPGLCAVSEDDTSYLVLPCGEGIVLTTSGLPADLYLPTWDAEIGLTMPFCGAVRSAGGENASPSLLTLITDSAYSGLRVNREAGSASGSWEYRRDPERRRLDLRVLLDAGGDETQIARNYREKIISDRNHIPLRRKAQDRPVLASFLGIASEAEPVSPQWHDLDGLTASLPEAGNRWEAMEERLETITRSRTDQNPDHLVGDWGGCDWSCVLLEYVRDFRGCASLGTSVSVPLYSVVYHDVVVPVYTLKAVPDFLDALLRLGYGELSEGSAVPAEAITVLHEAVRHSFAAFLQSHRFRTPDGSVQEATYSDRTKIVINRNATETFISDDIVLPPFGFFLRHPRWEAHNALRLGEQTFPDRAWRIGRSRDGKPLSESGDIERREFVL